MSLLDKIIIFALGMLIFFAWLGFCGTIGKTLNLTNNQIFFLLISPVLFGLALINIR